MRLKIVIVDRVRAASDAPGSRGGLEVNKGDRGPHVGRLVARRGGLAVGAPGGAVASRLAGACSVIIRRPLLMVHHPMVLRAEGYEVFKGVLASFGTRLDVMKVQPAAVRAALAILIDVGALGLIAEIKGVHESRLLTRRL